MEVTKKGKKKEGIIINVDVMFLFNYGYVKVIENFDAKTHTRV